MYLNKNGLCQRVSAGLLLAISNMPMASAQSNTLMLEEVIVTATRREQNVNDVPLAVSAFSAEDMRRAGVAEVKDLARISPSLNIESGTSESGNTEVRMRGVGTNGSNPGLEASVGIFIDEVYRSRSGLAMGEMLDIDRVEILRGPQGTLFGRNTSAGALSIHSAVPDYEMGGRIVADVQNYSGRKLELGVTGPLVADKLAFRLAGLHYERDGFIENRVGPEEMYDRDRSLFKGQMLWDVSEDLQLRLIGDYSKQQEQCCAADYVVAGPTAPIVQSLGGIVKTDPFAYKTQVNFKSKDNNEEYGVTLLADWQLSDALNLKYVGAWRDNDVESNLDPDSSNLDLLQGTNNESDIKLQTHELRLSGQHGRLDWLVGSYYYEENIDVSWRLVFGSQFGEYFSELLSGGLLPPSLFPEGMGDDQRLFDQDADGFALFTHNVVELTDALDLVLGLRWSKDNKDGAGEVENTSIHCDLVPSLICPTPSFDESNSDDEPTGTLKLVHTADNTMFYGGYTRGYKAGGFNLDRDASITSTQFKPEIVDSYEIGAKITGLDGRLQLNTAVFYSTFDDYQINEFDGISFSITNAGEAESKGIEMELDYLINEEFGLSLGVTRLNAEYKEHPGFNSAGESLEGEPLSRAPDWSGVASLRYATQLGEYAFSANLIAAYADDQNIGANADPEAEQGSTTKVDAQMSLATADQNWMLTLWGKNIFEEDYNVAIFTSPLQAGSYSAFRGQPRTYGLTVRRQF